MKRASARTILKTELPSLLAPCLAYLLIVSPSAYHNDPADQARATRTATKPAPGIGIRKDCVSPQQLTSLCF